MQCSFAFLEAGAVRAKKCTNILTKKFLDSCIFLFYFFWQFYKNFSNYNYWLLGTWLGVCL